MGSVLTAGAVEPVAAEVTQHTQNSAQEHGGDQLLPVAAGGEGAEAAHENALWQKSLRRMI